MIAVVTPVGRGRTRSRWLRAARLALVATLAPLAACLVDIDYSGTAFRCTTTTECPDDLVCDGQICRAPDAAADAGTDGPAGLVCGDSLCTETCQSCAGDCGACLDDMVLYLPGDEAAESPPIDASGGGAVLEQTGVGRVDSPQGRAFAFDGSGGTLVLRDSVALRTANVALAGFFRSDAAVPGSNGQELASLGDVWAIRITLEGEARFFGYNGVDFTGCTTTGMALLDGQWHHVAGHHDDGELAIFVDGVLRETCVMPAPLSYTLGTDFVVGQHGDGANIYAFNGAIDDLRVFSRPLTEAEVATLAGN